MCSRCCAGTSTGCTDPAADNYDPLASEEDGSCIFPPAPVADEHSVSDTRVAQTAGPQNPDVAFCHVDDHDGPDGPFDYMTRSPHQIFAQGHANDGVYDIIPPFIYGNAQQHPGVNWPSDPADQADLEAFIANSCSDLGSIAGTKWNDQNGDGAWDNSEAGLSDWTIELHDSDGVIETTATNDNGEFWFTDVVPGTYTVCEVQQEGWLQTYPSPELCQEVTVNIAGEVTDVDFGNQLIPLESPVCDYGFGPDNLLSNGSFEEPVIKPTWALTSITDWVITKVSDGTPVDGELWRGLMGGASDGEQNVELDSTEPTKLTQNVVTIPGALYELRFDFSARKGSDATNNDVDGLADGALVVNAAADGSNLTENDWNTYSGTFVADASTDITFADNGTANGNGSLVDNAVLCLVQEPEPEPEDPWCSFEGSITDYTPDVDAKKNNGNPVDAARRNVTAVETVAPYQNIGGKEGNDWQVNPLDFFTLGIEGFLVYEFSAQVAFDQVGADIGVYEITGGTGGQTDEKIEVSVSQNGVDFISLGEFTGDADIDISPAGLDYVKYVRLDDRSSGIQGPNGDGYDVDAIVILNGSCGDEPEINTCLVDGYKYDTQGLPLEGWEIGLGGEFYEYLNNDGGAYVYETYTDITDKDGYYCIEEYREEVTSTQQQTQDDSPLEAGRNYVVGEIMKDGWSFDRALVNDVPTPQSTQPDSFFDIWVDIKLPSPGETTRVTFYNEEDDALVCAQGVNLVENGGFEAPVVDNDAGWDIFDLSTYPALAWVVEFVDTFAGAPDEASLELQRSVLDWEASEGEQYAELDTDWDGPGGTNGDAASVIISQTIETIPGEEYELSWDFLPRPGTAQPENDLEVFVGGTEAGDKVANNTAAGGGATAADWVPDNYVFTATGAETVIAFRDGGEPNSVGTFVDNVSLTCNPQSNGGEDLYKIQGYVWHDDNEDEVWDEDEDPLAGWTVKATDGESSYETTSDSSGYYSFMVPAGTWTITQVEEGGWVLITQPTYEVTVPSVPALTLGEKIRGFFIPTAFAVTLEEVFGDYNFGNNEEKSSRSSGGRRSSGGGGDDAPEPQVLGEQVSIVPLGAANAGAGGAAPVETGATVLTAALVGRTLRKNA